jgi:hypothetical protein
MFIRRRVVLGVPNMNDALEIQERELSFGFGRGVDIWSEFSPS